MKRIEEIVNLWNAIYPYQEAKISFKTVSKQYFEASAPNYSSEY